MGPKIIAGPGVTGRSAIDSTYLTVIMDVAPTFLEVAGAQYPDDGSVEPMLGESLIGFLAGEADTVHDEDYLTLLYHSGRAFLRRGELEDFES